MGAPRDHHFVPAFYLSEWCHSQGRLVEYSIKHDKLIAKPVGPQATGYQFDLYAFPELPPEQAQFVEQRFFDYADRTAANAFKLLLSGFSGKWDPELRNAWSRFLVALHLRHPDVVPELRSAAQAIWTGTGAASQSKYEAIRQPSDPSTFDEYIASTDPNIPAKAKLNLIVRAFDNDVVREHINNMHWDTLDLSGSTRALLTSDRSVSLFKLKAPREGSVSLPLSPTKLFVAVNDKSLLDALRRIRPRDIVSDANEKTVSRARRYVWAEDTSQSDFIAKRMSKNLDPTPLLPSAGRI